MDKFQISRSYLRTWLRKQETYTLHRPSRQHFKRPCVLVFQQNQEWDTDCAHLRQFADDDQGYSYFVVFIDIFTLSVHEIFENSKECRNS